MSGDNEEGQGETNLRIKHPNNLTTLIAHNLPLLDIIQRRHCKPSLILRIDLKIYIADVLVALMALDGIRPDVLARCVVCVGRGREVPAEFLHVPVYGGKGDDVLEAFELTDDERAVRPGAGVGDLRIRSQYSF